MRSRTCAEHHIHLSFTSIFASLVCGCQSEHALSQWPSQANSSIETKIVCGCRNARQSLSGVDVLWSRFWSRSCFYFVSMTSRACVDKMAEPKSRDRSSSTESQLKFPGCPLNEGLTLCTDDSPCEVCKDWLPEAWQAQEKANEQKRRRKVVGAGKAAKKSQERDTMDDSVEIHAAEEALQRPTKRKTDGSSKTKRSKTATGSVSKATEVERSASRPSRSHEPKKSVSSARLWWDGPGPTVVPGPRGRNATGHVVGSTIDDCTGPTDARTPQGLITLLDTTVDVERGSGPGPRHRVGPGWFDGWSGVEPCFFKGDGCPAFRVFLSFPSPSSQVIGWL